MTAKYPLCLGTCAWVPAVSGGLFDRVNLSLVYWRLSEKIHLIKERQNVFNFAFQFILTGINNREQLSRKLSIPLTRMGVFAPSSTPIRGCPSYVALLLFFIDQIPISLFSFITKSFLYIKELFYKSQTKCI